MAHIFSNGRIERVKATGCKGIEPALRNALDFVVLDTSTAWAVVCRGR